MYLIGTLLLCTVGLLFLVLLPRARAPLFWVSMQYMLFLIGAFVIGRLAYLGGLLSVQFVPDYWHPSTLFSFGTLTGGLALEDIFFMGGIAWIAGALPFLFWSPSGHVHHPRFPWLLTSCSLVLACIIVKFCSLSLIYVFLFSLFAGAYICIRRVELVSLGLVGMLGTVLLYGLLFTLFLWLYPGFVEETYVFEALSGRFIGTVPLEELFYAGSTGLFLSVVWWYATGARPSARFSHP
jgi:hypothetical protein